MVFQRVQLLSLLSLFSLAPTIWGQGITLSSYHPGCQSAGDGRTPPCMAAMHRYCTQNGMGSAAYPQEFGIDELGFLCADTLSYGDVAYGKIASCAGEISNLQSPPCFTATHQYCNGEGFNAIGVIQEIGNGVVGVGCIPHSWYNNVPFAELTYYHPGCSSVDKAQEPDCIAAVHRFCSNNGLGQGGAIVELQPFSVAVACISAARYVNLKVT